MCVCTHILNQLSVAGLVATWVVSMSWLLSIVLLGTLGCMDLFKLELSSFLNFHPGVGLLGHKEAL